MLRAAPEVLGIRRDGQLHLVDARGDIRPAIARALVDAGLVPVYVRLRTEELGEIYRRCFVEERDAGSSAGVS